MDSNHRLTEEQYLAIKRAAGVYTRQADNTWALRDYQHPDKEIYKGLSSPSMVGTSSETVG